MTAPNERFFCEYCEKYDLPHEMLLKRYSFFFEDRTICDELFSLLMREPKRKLSNLYYYEETLRPKVFFERLRVYSETYGADFEEFCLVAYIALAEKTRALHQKQDVSREISDRTLASIALWAHKHRALTGKIGLWDYYWCAKYLGGELFRLGELEYQACSNSFGNKHGLSENQILLRIHVPAVCDFSPAARLSSYRAAYDFFAPRIGKSTLTFVCESWLLAKDHASTLGKSNIASFRDDFSIVEEYKDYDSGFLWRIFGADDISTPSRLPQNTRVRAFYRDKLLKKEPFYSASGIFTMNEKREIEKPFD